MQSSVFGRTYFYVSPLGRYVGVAVGAFLLLAGLHFFASAASHVIDAVAAHDWVPTPATVSEISFEAANEQGESTVQWNVRYQYQFQNHDYEGNRFTLVGTPSYLQPLLQDTADKLTDAAKNHTSIECFVDPSNPTESVLNRQLFVTVIGVRIAATMGCWLFGGFLMNAIVMDHVRRRRHATLMAANLSEPWRWRDDWATGKIRSASRIDTWILTTVCIHGRSNTFFNSQAVR